MKTFRLVAIDRADNLHRLFSADHTDRIHVHNASRGCWAVTVERT